MRFIFLWLICCATISQAAPVTKPAPTQTVPVQPIGVAAIAPMPAPITLSIAPLAGVPVQLELNGSEANILGMLKSFARGLETANPKTDAANQSPSSGVLMALLNDGQISAALKDIHHLHLVVYNLNPLRDAAYQAENQDFLDNLGISMNSDQPAAKTPAPSKIPDAIAFYEPRFVAEGGQRLLMADFKNTKVLMLGFSAPQGFALVVSSPSRIIVARADGYPDMEIIGRMIHFGNNREATTPTSEQLDSSTP